MYRQLAVFFALWCFAHIAQATVNACPVTSGPLTLNVIEKRSSGIAPLVVFFDATGTTDTATLGGANNVFQDVTFLWNFGDSSPISGAGNWLYGSHSAYSGKAIATGAIAAHLYSLPIGATVDQDYQAIVTATDGTNTATCAVGLTVFAPSGANGFPGTKTTCVAATSTPIAGTGDCPAGAAVLETSSLTTATSTSRLGAGQRVLLHCGDTFTGNSPIIGANPTTQSNGTLGTATPKWSLGAYGGCEDTQSGRPIISLGEVQVDWASVDGRIADLDFEGSGASPPVGTALEVGANFALQATPALQTTLYNLLSNAYDESFYDSECTQCALVQVVQTEMGANQGTFWNLAENNCTNNSQVFGCGGTPSFTVNDYNAILGSSFNGAGSSSTTGPETVRISGGSWWVIENSTFLNATTSTAVLKFHAGNNQSSTCEWTGKTSQFWYISDNMFGGLAGGELVETTVQNGQKDERIQNVIVERNLFAPSSSGSQLLAGAMNETVRNNVFVNSGVTAGNRGFQGTSNNTSGSVCSGTGTSGAPTIPLYPQFNEAFNNTCHGGSCVSFGTNGNVSAANNSFLQNTLTFSSSAVSNSGSNNVVSNNSPNTTANPDFLNESGSFSVISDFKPTANFSGGVCLASVPVDALGVNFSASCDLGAVRH
jgi:hypothetical protein